MLSSPIRRSESEAEEALAALITDAVRLCRVADVPLGAFLSGGIDSTAVVAAMRDGGAPPKTFTIGFEDRGFDESHHAEAVARHLGTHHTTLVATDREALAIVPELGRLYDEPFADSSAVPTVLVSRLARRHVTVALSGDGGDELFGGYTRYALLERAAAVQRVLPRPVRSVISSVARGVLGVLPRFRLARAALLLGLPDTESLYRRFLVTGTEAGRLLPDASGVITPPAWEEALALRRAAMLHDTLAYLPDDILAKVDRASMSVGLEARVPLLDHRILALAAALPEALLADSRGGKALLRRVVERAVPRALIERPKMGFGVPLARWLAGPLRDWAEALLEPGRLSSGLGFDARAVRALWARALGGDRSAAAALWPVLMAEAWRTAREAAPIAAPMCHGGHDRDGPPSVRVGSGQSG
jgi:asparagine synthase (glutamine-hydrolysing)